MLDDVHQRYGATLGAERGGTELVEEARSSDPSGVGIVRYQQTVDDLRVLGGEVVRGAQGMAGEFGHMRLVPDGRTTERLVVVWLLVTFVVAGSLWLSPSPFPLP